MATVIVRHKVKDYESWKSAFEGFRDQRKAGGEMSFRILHLDDEPNNVFAIVEYDSLDNARNFFGGSELKEAMGNAGVMEQPDIYYLKEYFAG
ncbi:MAG: antibiotic biosynthesis monooxygenase [Bacteroidetes bacterium]|nr:antibiotic biosynthesis monooxygenase [Bacteroidota bacterium]